MNREQPAEGATGKLKPLRVGLIGCGAISTSHLEAFAAQEAIELIACADTNEQAARRCAERFAIPEALTQPAVLLRRDDIDLVSICVPPKWHAGMLLEAVAHRKHILIEKPLARDLVEADLMVDAVEQSDLIVGVALMHRYLPAYHVVRELLQAGAIGRVGLVRLCLGRAMQGDSRFTEPQLDPRSWLVDAEIAGGGMLMSSSIHFLSTFSFILGHPHAERVTARVRQLGARKFPGIEDEADLWLDLSDATGSRGNTEFVLRESWAIDVPYRAEFIGEDGYLTLSGEWNSLALEGHCTGEVPAAYRPYLQNQELSIDPAQLTHPVKPLFRGLVSDVVESIRQGRHLPRLPDARHARNMQAVVEAAYQSSRRGTSVEVDWR